MRRHTAANSRNGAKENQIAAFSHRYTYPPTPVDFIHDRKRMRPFLLLQWNQSHLINRLTYYQS